MATGTVLFCPFCREWSEETATCPDHDLPLVAFDALPRRKEDVVHAADDELLTTFDLRYGRGIVAAGALLVLVGFLLPLGYLVGSDSTEVTSYWLASARLRSVWVIPIAGLFALVLLAQRRTLERLRSVRVVAFMVSAVLLFSIGYAVYYLYYAAEHQIEGLDPVTPSIGAGAYVMVAGALVIAFGAARLGVVKGQEVLPHGAGPEENRRGIRTTSSDRNPKAKKSKKK